MRDEVAEGPHQSRSFLRDLVIGLVFGVLLVSLSASLDYYHGIIRIEGTTHRTCKSAVDLLTNSSATAASVDEASDPKYRDRSELETLTRNMVYLKEDYEAKVSELKGLQDQIDAIRQDHDDVMRKANDLLHLDKWCPECKWNGGVTCEGRVDFLRRTYNTNLKVGMISTMNRDSCIRSPP